MEAHITLPKTTLLRFADEQSKKVAYYDLATGAIEERFPKRYNTGTNYYPDDFEKWLSSKVERYIGILNRNLEILEHEEGSMYLINDALKKALIRIIVAQTFRVPDSLDVLMDTKERNSRIDELWKANIEAGNVNPYTLAARDRLRREVATPENKRRAFYRKEKFEKIAEQFERKKLSNYTVNIAIVSENVPASFLLPAAHYFQSGKQIILPVAPRYAYVLLPREDNEKHYIIDKDKGRYGVIDIQEDDLMWLVADCVIAARLFREKHLIGTRQFLTKLSGSGRLQQLMKEELPRRYSLFS